MQARILLATLALCAGAAVAQQDYPNKAVTVVVPWPAGGPSDIAARPIAKGLTDQLGKPFVIDNRGGASGNIGSAIVAKQQPADGYTVLITSSSPIVINPSLYKAMPFDSAKDLLPITNVLRVPLVLAVNPAVPVHSLAEFIEYARRTRPPLAYASGGNGSQHQLAMELLKQRAGIDLLHVPFKGGTPATAATVAGDTAALFSGTSTAPQIRAGKLRALAVTGAKRSPEFPDLPTIGELYPGYEVTIWLGLFAPAGTPEPVVARLRAEVARALADPGVVARLKSAGGLEPMSTTPQQFAALIRSDYDKYGKLVREVGAHID